jgi:hypothetical protein
MMFNPHRAINPIEGICHKTVSRRAMHAQSVFGAVVDFVFATLPVFIMKDLRLRRAQKIGLWGVVLMAEL